MQSYQLCSQERDYRLSYQAYKNACPLISRSSILPPFHLSLPRPPNQKKWSSVQYARNASECTVIIMVTCAAKGGSILDGQKIKRQYLTFQNFPSSVRSWQCFLLVFMIYYKYSFLHSSDNQTQRAKHETEQNQKPAHLQAKSIYYNFRHNHWSCRGLNPQT